MMKAAMMGAVAFQKGLGACHSLAHPLSNICGLHHGLANALCLPAVVEFNGEVAEARLVEAARALGAELRPRGLSAKLRELRTSIGLARSLAAAGVKREQLDAARRRRHRRCLSSVVTRAPAPGPIFWHCTKPRCESRFGRMRPSVTVRRAPRETITEASETSGTLFALTSRVRIIYAQSGGGGQGDHKVGRAASATSEISTSQSERAELTARARSSAERASCAVRR